MLDGSTIFSRPKAIKAWDASFSTDSDEVIVAVAQGDVNTPSEVYTTTASGGALVKLSNHGHALEGKQFGVQEFLKCASTDGEIELNAVWTTPTTHAEDDDTAKPSKPLPTVLFVHGGPYDRSTNTFDDGYMWVPLLLDAGYAVLQPNYRGGSGRGNAFAAVCRGACGVKDYEDVITLTQHAVELGYADPEKLVISGWSQGGFHAYMAAARNGRHGYGWRFKGAIAGAGVSDWDTLTMTSDMPTFESGLTGKAPWKCAKGDTSGRSGSALWEFKDAAEGSVIPRMLILHGEKDERVPIEQAVGFRRALESAELPFEMVVYPREGHVFKERKHLIDMGGRVVRFVGECLNE
jgi:dipeptidyl aminopeptidase/acylaminoacyl peptidase